jgi:hypothetical protein
MGLSFRIAHKIVAYRGNGMDGEMGELDGNVLHI